MEKDKLDKKTNNYFKTLQTLFNTDDIELVYEFGRVSIFKVEEKNLLMIEGDDDAWTIKHLHTKE